MAQGATAAQPLHGLLSSYRQTLETRVLPTLLDRSPIFWPGFDKLRRDASLRHAPAYLEAHRSLEMAHIVRGVGRVYYNNEWCVAHTGDTFILPGSLQHDFTSGISADFCALWIFCSPREDQLHFQHRQEPMSPLNLQLRLSRSQAAQRSLDNLVYRISYTSRQLDLSLWASVVQLVVDMIDNLDIQSPAGAHQDAELLHTHWQAVQTVRYMLRRDLREDVDLDTLANAVGFTKSYLCTLYKKVAGETIFDTLRRIRLQKAKELLQQSNMPIKEIAEAVGYRNISSFTRAFHACYSCAPNQLRLLAHRSGSPGVE